MPENAQQQQEKAIDAVREWGKWLVGLNFASAAGCVAILQQGGSSAVKVYLVGAVFFFAVSVLLTAIIFTIIPSLLQQLPLQDDGDGQVKSIYKYRVIRSVSLKTLTRLQIASFIIALVCLHGWMILKPSQ